MRGLKKLILALIVGCGLSPSVFSPALALNTETMLELIGSLEAPEGHNQIYSGIKTPPPKPVTSMTIGDILDWQKEASKTSASAAVGRYQLNRFRIQKMVDDGIVKKTTVFSARVQDFLATHLLKNAGYRDGVSDTQTANNIARVWASLPQVSGPNKGQSYYRGLIDQNHALISADNFLAVMQGGENVETTLIRSQEIKSARDYGNSIDELVRKLAEYSSQIVKGVQGYALELMYALFAVQLVFHGAKALFGGSLSTFFMDTTVRVLGLTLIIFCIMNGGALLKLIEVAATNISFAITETDNISLGNFIAKRQILNIQMQERLISQTSTMELTLYEAAISKITISAEELVLATIIMISRLLTFAFVSVVIWHYSMVFLGAAIGMFVISFGAIGELKSTTIKVLSMFVSSVLRITAVHIIFFIFMDCVKIITIESDVLSSATQILSLDVLFLCFIVIFPSKICQFGQLKQGGNG